MNARDDGTRSTSSAKRPASFGDAADLPTLSSKMNDKTGADPEIILVIVSAIIEARKKIVGIDDAN